MDLGKSLRIALAKDGTSQITLANDLDVTKQVISLWVRSGNITRDNIRVLAKYFNMKVSEFIALGE